MATQVPLKILITDPTIHDHPEILDQLMKLEAAGHDITVDPSLLKYDFICGPNCWFLRPEVAGLFTLAVTNARKIANADEERQHANKERLKQNRPAKAATRKPKPASKPRAGVPKTKEHIEGPLDPLPGQLDFTTDIEADSFGAGA